MRSRVGFVWISSDLPPTLKKIKNCYRQLDAYDCVNIPVHIDLQWAVIISRVYSHHISSMPGISGTTDAPTWIKGLLKMNE